jgi:hypothetical protein
VRTDAVTALIENAQGVEALQFTKDVRSRLNRASFDFARAVRESVRSDDPFFAHE